MTKEEKAEQKKVYNSIKELRNKKDLSFKERNFLTIQEKRLIKLKKRSGK